MHGPHLLSGLRPGSQLSSELAFCCAALHGYCVSAKSRQSCLASHTQSRITLGPKNVRAFFLLIAVKCVRRYKKNPVLAPKNCWPSGKCPVCKIKSPKSVSASFFCGWPQSISSLSVLVLSTSQMLKLQRSGWNLEVSWSCGWDSCKPPVVRLSDTIRGGRQANAGLQVQLRQALMKCCVEFKVASYL